MTQNADLVKQAYHHKDLRNALLDEAMAMLAESGSAALTLRELARRLGVTHTAPYAHFTDKLALLRAVVDRGFGRLADALAAAKERSSDPAAAFREMTHAYVGFARSEPNLYRLMLADEQVCAEPDGEMSPGGDRAFGLLVATMRELGVPEAMLGNASVAAWAFVHGLAMLEIDERISGKTLGEGREVADLGCDVFVRGLRASVGLSRA